MGVPGRFRADSLRPGRSGSQGLFAEYARLYVAANTGSAITKYDAYMPRLKYLQDEAVHDGHELNLASEIDFQNFVQSDPDIRRGNLVLMDNGNLRATWKDEHGTRLSLQFLGGGMVQFVLFKRRRQGQLVSRVSGRDSLGGLKWQIVAFELNSLLYA